MGHLERFLTPELTEKSILFEVFTNNEDESDALKLMSTLIEDSMMKIKQDLKSMMSQPVKNLLKKVVK